jgi:hypothetical protein
MKELITEVMLIMQEPPTNPKQDSYKRLLEIYSEIHRYKPACTDCDFYAILRYFKNLSTNNVYMRTNRIYKPVDRFLGQAFTLNGTVYPPDSLTDATIEMLIKSGGFYLGTHFEKVPEDTEPNPTTDEFTPLSGDASKEIQDPIIAPTTNGRGRRRKAE